MIYICRSHSAKGYSLYAQDDGRVWAHMGSSESDEELLQFAKAIGLPKDELKRAGTEYAHFDLTRAMTDKAMKGGAKPVTAGDYTKMTVGKRREKMRVAEEG